MGNDGPESIELMKLALKHPSFVFAPSILEDFVFGIPNEAAKVLYSDPRADLSLALKKVQEEGKLKEWKDFLLSNTSNQ